MSLLIIGAGVFGLSTAIQAQNKGYSVTVIDKHTVPSPYSAACDINKIIRSEYDSDFYARMSLDAIEAWKSDPEYSETYFECGRLSVCPKSNTNRRRFDDISIAVLSELGKADKITRYDNAESLKRDLPSLRDCEFSSENAYVYNGRAGYAHSSNALKAAWRKAVRCGVHFVFGEAGEAVGIEETDGKPTVTVKSGATYSADKILVACGASSGFVINVAGVQSATGLFVTHIQLTPDEAAKVQDIPVIFDAGLGYFFPPDKETGLMKICISGTAAVNTVANPHATGTLPLPRYKCDMPKDTIPESCLSHARELLTKYFPELATKPFMGSRTCWIADSSNSDFIIDKVPGHSNVYLASGDSGHGFKFLPNIGVYILEMLEGHLDAATAERWKWRSEPEGLEMYKNTDWKLTKQLLEFDEISFAKE
ncbi:hypothetical protein KL935_003530 [Ogataea polymorpha]|nr:hypothetical protein KL935_003530 [Ogataea polymorpha]KAG7904436.1 hypothetical protein KL907_003312 [Ogataea polymorpha]